MSDIVEELDVIAKHRSTGLATKAACEEAITTITALRAELESIRGSENYMTISALNAEKETWKAHVSRLRLQLDAEEAAHKKCRKEKNRLVLQAYPAMDERDTLRAELERKDAALRKLIQACHNGRLVSLGAGGMTIEAQFRNSVYNRVNAWAVAEAEEALDALSPAQKEGEA